MPELLLAAMPPILAALIEAGSGPILRPSGARRRLTSAPTMAGPTCTVLPPAPMWQVARPSPSSTSTPSVTAWPHRLVPAARKVTGRPWSRAMRVTSQTSASSFTTATTSGMRR